MSQELGDPKSLGGAGQIGELRPGPRGGLLRRGNPDHAGGRARADFKAMSRQMMTDPAVREAVRAILTDPSNRNFAAVWKAVADRAFGPVVQRVNVKGKHTVTGVVLLPEASWGAPQPQALPQPPLHDNGRPGTAAPLALPAAALPGLAGMVAEALAAAAAADPDPDPDPDDTI
jgi:hypothetical protein